MKINRTFKFIGIVVFLAGLVQIGSYFLLSPQPSPDKPTDTLSVADNLFGWKYPTVKFPMTGPDQIAYSDIRDPGGIPQGLPIRLKIPIIGVDAAIEDALITPDGRMDVPQGSVNVAWFALGPHPGREGSAVIGGHFGIRNGVKFVFYDLDKLKVGDKVYIVDDKGDTLAFQVRRIQLFERDADATTVFTSDDGKAHLNIITCEGIWNRVNDTYPQRRVVFTDAIPAEVAGTTPPTTTPPTTKPQAVVTFPRSLSLGMKGTDVAALQTALEQKGLLRMPRGIAKGYYGTLTRTAVAKYQTSVGLPSNGVFGASTIVKLVSELSPVAVKPSRPISAIETPGPTHIPTLPPAGQFSQTFTQSIKSLYETPMDGLVTSSLIIAIIFIAFKIIRRNKLI